MAWHFAEMISLQKLWRLQEEQPAGKQQELALCKRRWARSWTQYHNWQGRSLTSPTAPKWGNKTDPVEVTRIRYSSVGTTQVHSGESGLRSGWKSAAGLSLGLEQWAQSQGQAQLWHSRWFSSDGGQMEGALLKRRSTGSISPAWGLPASKASKRGGAALSCTSSKLALSPGS